MAEKRRTSFMDVPLVHYRLSPNSNVSLKIVHVGNKQKRRPILFDKSLQPKNICATILSLDYRHQDLSK